ncbi:saccharopine dehydrogenase [Apiospora marii]|uniref:Saccharopine dehydrogenase n=1 Tax=Apiospora marii TaxID=335849 RepID=A0ABR1R733_9PEZI
MAPQQSNRQYDIVVFGATGYTGFMTAEHIAERLPTNLKWAVAGRSEEKLKRVVSECQKLNPDRVKPEIEVCNLNDQELYALAKKTKAMICTVGPFAQFGEHAFKACAEAGTHYIDCTGEVVWTLSMIRKYEAAAKKSGIVMIPQCGFDSAPSDLLTWSMAQLVRSKLSAPVSDVVVSIHDLKTKPSGGTLATILGLVETYSLKEIGASKVPFALSPVPNSYHGPAPSLFSKLTGVRVVPHLGLLCTSVTAATDEPIVQRTWGLLQQERSRQKQAYGPRFSYREFARAKSTLSGMVAHYGLVIGMTMLALFAPVRNLMRRHIFQPGEGVSKEDAAKEYIVMRGTAVPDVQPKSDKVAMIEANYKSSPYILTATCLAQAAYSIINDDHQLEGGVYTPACLGQQFIDRLDGEGFKIETKLIDA